MCQMLGLVGSDVDVYIELDPTGLELVEGKYRVPLASVKYGSDFEEGILLTNITK